MDQGQEEQLAIAPQNLQKGKKLGKGILGEVLSGLWKQNNKVAIKQFGKAQLDDTNEFEEDLKAICKLDQSFVIKMIGYTPSPLSLVMELMSTSLFQYLRGKGEIKWNQLYQISLDIITDLQYLHSMNIVHGNLTSTNVFVNRQGKAKIGDLEFLGLKVLQRQMKAPSRLQ